MFCLRVWAVALLCVLLPAPRVGAIGPRAVENGHPGLGMPNASAEPVEASLYVLPNVSTPVSYELFVDLSDASFQTYSGTVDITFQQTVTGKSLPLNSVGLIVNESTLRVTQSTGNAIPIERFESVPESQMIVLHCSESLEPGEVYRAHLEFAGSINIDFFKGLYRSSYRTENGVKYLATTFFAAIYARTVFPCYDEPAYKATFGVKIRHHDKHTALSNMPAIDSVPSGEFVDTSFQTTPIMSTYLVAFVVSELKTLPTQDGLFRVYAPEGREHLTQYAHDFAFRALRYLENFFGRQNQMAKIDLVAIPDFAMGAMENWGLITFREDYLLHEQGVSTARSEQFVGAIVTHELAHMWFGNEVTPEWWTYVWLNEGFARYFENYITSQLEPSWNLWDQFVVVNVHSALSLDCHSNNRAMSYYATDPSVLNELYDYVVYAKSASVIRMIQNVIGIGPFRMAINDYLRSRSYLATAPQYLYTSIEKFRTVDLPASVEAIFESWANAPGYPLVTVTIDWNERKLTATQKRFWMPIEDESPPPNQLFFVPLNYATNLASSEDMDSTAATFWLTPSTPEATINIADDISMIFINKQQTGYYRVNYDKQSWEQLINVLNSDQFEERIPVINRAQLVDDVANLARAGEISYDVALSLMQYLERETEYIPWSTAYNALLHLDRMLSARVEYRRFESYMRNLTSFAYREIGLTGKLDHMSQLHRDKTLYLACYFGVPECMSAANSVLETATLKESLDVHADLQSTVFCAFNKHKLSAGSAYEVALFYQYFLTPDKFQPLVDSFVTSLGCSQDAAMIQFYLAMVEMNVPGIPIPDALRSHILVSLIEGGPTARQAALQYVSGNFMSLSQLLPEQTIVSIFEAIGPSIISSQEYDMLKVTLSLHAESMVPSVAEAANRAVKEAERSLSWIGKYSGTIAEWLVAQNYEGAPPDPSDNGASTAIVELSMLIGITVMTLWSVRFLFLMA